MKSFTHIALLALATASQAASLDRAEIAWEQLSTEAISIDQVTAQAASTIAGWQTTSTLTARRFAIDYQPTDFDFRGQAVHREESAQALQLATRKPLGERWTALLSTGYRDGFSNYRTLWLDEYFHQQFSELQGVQGAERYVEADPWSANASAGLRWEYLIASAFAQIVVATQEESVSPGYEIDFDGLRRSELSLATTSIDLSTENLLSRRLRSRTTLRATKTTQRSWRYAGEFALNAALSERWTARLRVGATTEDPQFDAYYSDLTFEFAATEHLSLYSDFHYYQDTGEVEDALLFSTAAPGVESSKFGLGVIWRDEAWSARAYYAPLRARYEPPESSVDFFEHLYQDRNWNTFQIAVSRSL